MLLIYEIAKLAFSYIRSISRPFGFDLYIKCQYNYNHKYKYYDKLGCIMTTTVPQQ